jgi:hypothetical protein
MSSAETVSSASLLAADLPLVSGVTLGMGDSCFGLEAGLADANRDAISSAETVSSSSLLAADLP